MKYIYLLLGALATLGVYAAFMQLSSSPRPPPDPLTAHAPCEQQVAGPTQRWLCSDQHAWDRYPDGHWQDAGLVSGMPRTPKN